MCVCVYDRSFHPGGHARQRSRRMQINRGNWKVLRARGRAELFYVSILMIFYWNASSLLFRLLIVRVFFFTTV